MKAECDSWIQYGDISLLWFGGQSLVGAICLKVNCSVF